MSILNELVEESINFHAATGKPPKYMFLGQDQYELFLQDISHFLHIKLRRPASLASSPPVFSGMFVVEVKMQNFIGFGVGEIYE